MAYVGGSVTPYYNLNPGYRIYYVDGDHDHSTRVRNFRKICTYLNCFIFVVAFAGGGRPRIVDDELA